MSDDNKYIDILKSIKTLLNKNLWLEAKEYLQIELDNIEKNCESNINNKLKNKMTQKH